MTQTMFLRQGAALAAMMLLLTALAAIPTASALQATDTHVGAFTVSPAFINLNRTTTVSLTVASLYGSANDNYRVTVYTPAGAALVTGWFNFTEVGTKTLLLGNATQGFMTTVTQVGEYRIEAEHATGSTFAFAAATSLQTTDKLLVITEFAAASNPYTDEHNCPIAEEFQRGDEIIARGYIRYLSTGEIVNATNVPTAVGKMKGTLFEETRTLNYHAKSFFYRSAWMIPWDKPLGTYSFTVQADDGMGNTGVGVSPGVGIYGALRIIPSILETSAWTTNGTSGEGTTAFFPGETVTINARPVYDLHFAHNFNYTKTTRAEAGTVAAPGKGQQYPLGTDRSGVVTASVGTGFYNTTTLAFANNLATVELKFNEATGNWSGTWVVPADAGTLGDISIRVNAKDGALPPNKGSAGATLTTLVKPEPVKEIVKEVLTEVKTEYVNQTIEVEKAGLGPLGYGLVGLALVAGAGGGYAFTRSRAGGAKKDEDWE